MIRTGLEAEYFRKYHKAAAEEKARKERAKDASSYFFKGSSVPAAKPDCFSAYHWRAEPGFKVEFRSDGSLERVD